MLLKGKMWALLLISLGLLWGCGDGSHSDGDSSTIDARSLSLTIMHVNDTHSHLDAISGGSVMLNGTQTYMDMGGFARLSAKVNRVRTEKENLLLLHGGDAVQGTLYFTQTEGKADFDLLNLLGFDAMVLGNHEFDKGSATAASFYGLAEFPLVSANIDASADANLADLVVPYIIQEIDGTRVAVVGLTLEDTAVISSPGDDVVFNAVVDTAQTVVASLESQGINKIIFLTHLGYGGDMALARSVSGIDLIVGGHSHTLLGDFNALGLAAEGAYPTVVANPDNENVYIVQAWEWAKVTGVLDVEFDADGQVTSCAGNAVLLVDDNFQQKDVDGNKQDVDEATHAALLAAIEENPAIEVVAEDEAALAVLAPYQEAVEELDHTVIGQAAADLLHIREPGTHTSGVELPNGSHIAPHVCEAMVWKANTTGDLGVDMAIQNAGGVRIDVPAGDITVGTAYTLLPFGNTLVVLELTGAQIVEALEIGVERSGGAFPYVGHARYTADATAPAGSRILSVELADGEGGWTVIDPAATYRVATNSYMAGGGDGYTVLGEADGYRLDTGWVDAETFMGYVQAQEVLDIPEETGVTWLIEEAAAAVALP